MELAPGPKLSNCLFGASTRRWLLIYFIFCRDRKFIFLVVISVVNDSTLNRKFLVHVPQDVVVESKNVINSCLFCFCFFQDARPACLPSLPRATCPTWRRTASTRASTTTRARRATTRTRTASPPSSPSTRTTFTSSRWSCFRQSECRRKSSRDLRSCPLPVRQSSRHSK